MAGGTLFKNRGERNVSGAERTVSRGEWIASGCETILSGV